MLSCRIILTEPDQNQGNMDFIRQILVRAKHWHIFFLLIGTYALSVLAVTQLSPKLKPGIEHNSISLCLLIAAGIAPYILSVFGWLWAAGSLFNANLQPELRLRTGFFRFAIVYAVLGLVFGLPVLWASNQRQQDWLTLPAFFGVICIVYIMKFTAKTFANLNRGRRSSLWNYGGYMVEFLSIPLFVWKIQPRINRLSATAEKPTA